MSISLYFDVEDHVSERLRTFIVALDDRTDLHRAIAGEAADLTREHLQMIAETRHKTAEELGAEPTGFWARAVEQVTTAASNDAGVVSVNSPGIGRAGHDVDIYPTDGREYLTIPIHPLAYGHRVSELAANFEIFALHTGPSGTGILAFRQPGQHVATALYLLVPEVHQKQDRTLLPSDEEYETVALQGISNYVEFLLAQKGNG